MSTRSYETKTMNDSDISTYKETYQKLDDPTNFCNTFWNKLGDLENYTGIVYDFTKEFHQILIQYQSYFQPFIAAYKELCKQLVNLEKKYSNKNFDYMEMLIKKVKCYTTASTSEYSMLSHQSKNLHAYLSNLKTQINNYESKLVPSLNQLKKMYSESKDKVDKSYIEFQKNAKDLEKVYIQKKVESYQRCLSQPNYTLLQAQQKKDIRKSGKKQSEESPEALAARHLQLKEKLNDNKKSFKELSQNQFYNNTQHSFAVNLGTLINKDFTVRFDELLKKDIAKFERTTSDFKKESDESLKLVPNMEYVHFIDSCKGKSKEFNHNTYLLTSMIEKDYKLCKEQKKQKKPKEFKNYTKSYILARIDNTALPKLELSNDDISHFLQYFECEKDFYSKKEEFLKNIEIIGCLTYKAIEQESQTSEEIERMNSFIKETVYQSVFLMFLQVWRKIYRFEFNPQGYDLICYLINLCNEYANEKKQLTFVKNILIISEAYYVNISPGLIKGAKIEYEMERVSYKEGIGTTYNLHFENKSKCEIGLSYYDHNGFWQFEEKIASNGEVNIETQTNLTYAIYIYDENSQGAIKGKIICQYTPHESLDYTKRISLETNINLKVNYQPQELNKKKFLNQNLRCNKIWSNEDFWRTYLLNSIQKKIAKHDLGLNTSCDLNSKIEQLKTSIVCIFSEVVMYMSRLHVTRSEINNFLKTYTKLFDITDEDSLKCITIALK